MNILAGTSSGIHVVTPQGSECVGDFPGVRDFCIVGDDLFAATASGIARSRDGARSWQPQALESLQMWQIRRAPDGTLYAVTQPAGLWYSRDHGDSWLPVDAFTDFPGAAEWCVPLDPPLPGRARTLVIDQNDPARLWVGVEVGGIMNSTDGGTSWRFTQPGGNPDIHVLVARPDAPDELFVSTGYGRPDGIADMKTGNAGMFRSRDGGASWEYVWHGMSPVYTRPLCIDPRPPYPLTVASAPSPFSACTDPGGAGAMLFRSDDRGDSWRSLGDADHAPSAANFHGLAPASGAVGSVLAGTDAGELWRIDAAGRWTCVVSGLPAVLTILDRDLQDTGQ